MRLFSSLGKSGSAGLFATFAVLAIVCMAVPFSLGSASLTSEIDDRMSESSQATAQSVAGQLQQLSSLLTAASSDERLLSTDTFVADTQNPLRRVVDNLKASSGSVRVASFLDSRGVLVADSPLDANVGQDFSYREYFRAAIAEPGKPHISKPFTAQLPGLPTVVTVSIAVQSPATPSRPPTTVGVLALTLDLNASLTPLIEPFDRGASIEVSIFDTLHNRIIGEPTPLEESIEFERRLEAAAVGSTFHGIIGSPEGDYVVSLSPVPGTAFIVATTATAESAFGPLRSFQYRMFALAALAGLGMLAAAFLLSRSFRARDKALHEVVVNGQRTKLIVETAGQAFIECDAAGTVTSWNAAAESLFHWKSDEALGQDIHSLIAPTWRMEEAIGETAAAFARFDGSSKATKSERSLVRKDSDVPFPGLMTRWVTELDAELRMGLFIEDVTERRQMEAARELVFRRQRELVEELREADQTKNDFMSTVSHELRTPLTSIVGYLEMLREGYGGEFNNKASSMLDVIDRNAQRLLGLIEDLLTLSRIEAGSERTHSFLIDVRYLIDQVAQALLPALRGKHLTFALDVASDLPHVEGDYSQLERVMLNLLSNAVKFTPEGGRVSIRAWRQDQSLCLEINDTGIGIPVEEQHRLFTRFFRSSTARDQAIQGTGLGLTIVKSIIERHHGSVSVTSAINLGTTVLITLPVAAERDGRTVVEAHETL